MSFVVVGMGVGFAGCSCLGVLLVFVGLWLGGVVVGIVTMVFGVVLGAYFSTFVVVLALLIVIVAALTLGAGVVVAACEIYCAIAHIAFPDIVVVVDSACFLGFPLAYWM